MITAQQVKELREKTGAGMMDCKNALKKAEGDFTKAEKILRELGIVAAAKRSGRTVNEGRIFAAQNAQCAVILELSCETDFVARNDQFINLGKQLAEKIALGETDNLNDAVLETAALIKENIQLKRYEVVKKTPASLCATYIHGEIGNVGSLVHINVEENSVLPNKDLDAFAFDCALHVAAFKPHYLSPETIPEDYIAEQKSIFMEQVKKMDKPQNILDGIIEGKLRKHFNEICLLNQPFVKDDTVSVKDKIKTLSSQIGTGFTIAGYQVLLVGE